MVDEAEYIENSSEEVAGEAGPEKEEVVRGRGRGLGVLS